MKLTTNQIENLREINDILTEWSKLYDYTPIQLDWLEHQEKIKILKNKRYNA